jgi:ribosomal protein S18 acetylase RimI-like enzyme
MRAMIRLEPMTQADYDAYVASAVKGYAQAHIKAGDCEPEDSLALAQADYDSLLPRGLQTPNQHLMSVYVDGDAKPIGLIWFQAREKRGRRSAYIFDFEIRPELRGKGYGAATLQALETLVGTMGITRINLNVFDYNHAAKALYARCGFTVAGIGMTKNLATPSGA